MTRVKIYAQISAWKTHQLSKFIQLRRSCELYLKPLKIHLKFID